MGFTVNLPLLKAFEQGWPNWLILFFIDEDGVLIYFQVFLLLLISLQCTFFGFFSS